MSSNVAVVTGSNKGIGFGIVRALCKQFNGDVILTARDESRGKKAVIDLQNEGLHPIFHQLDIDDEQSINTLREFLVSNYGGLNILVNNASIKFIRTSISTFAEEAEVTMKTNFWGTLRICDNLFPILKSGARVSTVSSMNAARDLAKCSPAKKAEILALTSIDQLKVLVNEFVQAAKDDVLEKIGWPKAAYGTSKIAINALTILQQQMIDKDTIRSDILINCCHPGYVATDMTSHKGPLTIDEGAITPVYLALLPPNTSSPKGNYVKELVIEEWK